MRASILNIVFRIATRPHICYEIKQHTKWAHEDDEQICHIIFVCLLIPVNGVVPNDFEYFVLFVCRIGEVTKNTMLRLC